MSVEFKVFEYNPTSTDNFENRKAVDDKTDVILIVCCFGALFLTAFCVYLVFKESIHHMYRRIRYNDTGAGVVLISNARSASTRTLDLSGFVFRHQEPVEVLGIDMPPTYDEVENGVYTIDIRDHISDTNVSIHEYEAEADQNLPPDYWTTCDQLPEYPGVR